MNSIIQTIGPVWTVRILTSFQLLGSVFQSIAYMSINTVNAIMNFLNGTSSRYVFLRGGCGPIPAAMVPNYMTSPVVSWVYESQTNTLYYMNPEVGSPIERNLPVLSMGVRTPMRMYSADEFAGMFSYSAPRNVMPNPRLLLCCWSIYSRVWTVPNIETGEGAVFSVITQEGETVDHPIFFRGEEDVTRWDTLFHVEGDEDESESESESDAGEDDDGTDGDDEGVEDDDEGDGEDETSGDEEGDVEDETGHEEGGDEGSNNGHGDVESESGGENVPVPEGAMLTQSSEAEIQQINETDNATPTIATELTDD